MSMSCRYVVNFGDAGVDPSVVVVSADDGMKAVPSGVLMHYYMGISDIDSVGDPGNPVAERVFIDVVIVDGNKYSVSASIEPDTYVDAISLFYAGNLLGDFLLEVWSDSLEDREVVGPLDMAMARGWQAPREDIEA